MTFWCWCQCMTLSSSLLKTMYKCNVLKAMTLYDFCKTYRLYSFTFTSRAYYTWSSLHMSFLASLIVNWTCISFRSKEKMMQWRRPKLLAKVSSIVQSVTKSSLWQASCVSTWSPIRLKGLYYAKLLRCQSRVRYLLTQCIILIWICDNFNSCFPINFWYLYFS